MSSGENPLSVSQSHKEGQEQARTRNNALSVLQDNRATLTQPRSPPGTNGSVWGQVVYAHFPNTSYTYFGGF